MGKRKQSSPTQNVAYKRFREMKSDYLSQKRATAMVRSAMNRIAESKEIATTVSGNFYVTAGSLATTSGVTLLNAVAEGTDEFQRIGKKVSHKQLELSINIQNAGTGLSGWDAGFWGIVLDRQPNGAVPLFSDIFDVGSGSLTFANAGIAMRNTTTFQDRFVILKRCEYGIGSSNNGIYHVKEYLDLAKQLKGRDKTTAFSGTTAVVTSIDYGALYFVVGVSNPNTISSSYTQVAFNAKWKFTDL